MYKKISIIIIFILLFSLANADGIPSGDELQLKAEQQTQMISTRELKKLLNEELDAVLIDIRTADEIRKMKGTIDVEQNINIPRGWLEFRVQRVALDKNTPIVVYCGAGLRSPFAAKTLMDMGYSNVKNYSEGFFAWRKAGLPVKKE